MTHMREKFINPKLLIFVGLGLLIINGGWTILNWSATSPSAGTKDSGKYPLLSKRIFIDNQNDILINFTPLRQAMRDYVNKQPNGIGIYFEYLPSGTSIGVNEQQEVRIASLVKIPIVMATYKAIEGGVLDPNKMLTVNKEDLDDSFGDLWRRGVGTKLSIDQTIDLMLIKSDNTASRVLTDELPQFAIEEIFNSLDLPTERKDGYAVITPKSYTSILRSLYLSSYLNREHSNNILGILSRTDFSDKLPAGVPKDIKVAHKIGVFDQDKQHPVFSDCGIIYAPNRPYSLCIMTKDADENTSREQIKLLSKMVYGYIAQVK